MSSRVGMSVCTAISHTSPEPTWSGRGLEDLAELVEHLLLALADALGVEAQEAALLRGVGGALGRGLQPLAKLGGLLGRGLLDQQRVDRAELVEDLLARLRAPRLEALHRI